MIPSIDLGRHAGQLSRFLVVGMLSTVVNYGVFLILFRYASIQYVVASSLGFLAGIVAGFQLNRTWTYRHEASADMRLAGKYAIVYGVSLLINALLLDMLVQQAHLDPKIANVLTICVTTCTNFVATKLWVFKK